MKNVGLVSALAFAAIVAACGPAPQPETPTPPTPTDTPPTVPSAAPVTTMPSAAPVASAVPVTPTAPVTPPTPPTPAGPAGTPLQTSKLLADVKKIGFDMNKIPDLEKMPLAQKKKLMPLFQKALGYESCGGCHTEDMKAETRNKKITRGMWKTFVVALRDEKGGNLFCDSCHNGKNKVLNRADRAGIKKFMEDEYDHKLARADKKEHECADCHGDAMEMSILTKLWKVGDK